MQLSEKLIFPSRRFLRKPNVAEASEQFGRSQHKLSNPLTVRHYCILIYYFCIFCESGQLAKELKQQDCLQYAAFCNLAMAR